MNTVEILDGRDSVAEAHRRALELAAMPTLALAVGEGKSGMAVAFGADLRKAIDALLGKDATGAACCGHASDCAKHNEPAAPAGPCDCANG